MEHRVSHLVCATDPTYKTDELVKSGRIYRTRHLQQQQRDYSMICVICTSKRGLQERVQQQQHISQQTKKQDSAGAFVANMQRLQDVAAKQLATIDQQAARVDAERLAAIGLRQRAAALAEVCD